MRFETQLQFVSFACDNAETAKILCDKSVFTISYFASVFFKMIHFQINLIDGLCNS